MFTDIFERTGQQMLLELEKTRTRLAHAGNKGSILEDALREVMAEYLPRSMSVSHGEVVDLANNRSAQTDAVVLSSDHPPTYTNGMPGMFFIEGVLAAGEIKATLTAENLQQSITKARRFKQLKADQRGVLQLTSSQDTGRYNVTRPYFLFAYESAMSTESLGQALIDECHQDDIVLTDTVDAVFVLDKQISLVNFGDGTDGLRANTEGAPWHGWHHPRFFHPPLLGLMSWLSTTMPKEQRFEPVLLRYLMAAGQGEIIS